MPTSSRAQTRAGWLRFAAAIMLFAGIANALLLADAPTASEVRSA